MSRQVPSHDPDDYFAHTRMSFGDHIEDLRLHLLRAVAGFLVAMVLCLFLGQPILRFIAFPVEQELRVYYKKKAAELEAKWLEDPKMQERMKPQMIKKLVSAQSLLAALGKLGIPPQNNGGSGAPELVELEFQEKPGEVVDIAKEVVDKLGKEPKLIVLGVEEGFMIWMKICFVAGFVVASPWIFYQIWAFIAAGLYPKEKKLIHVYLPFGVGLFLAGILFAEFLVIPQAVSYLLWFNDWLGVTPELRLTNWLNFALMVPFVFGVAFQTPLAMFLLERIGIFTVDQYRKVRRLAFFILTILAAMLAPGDFVTMVVMVAALFVFYELGIMLCRFIPKPPEDIDTPDADEMIEV